MRTKRIEVQSTAGAYSVVCGAGAIRCAGTEIARLGEFSSLHIVSSKKVWRAVGKKVQRGVGAKNIDAVHIMEDAEKHKSLRTVELLARELVKEGAERKALLVAVGGGVVGDVAGFVAASYLRGVALVQIPTTVVAQVDSSIGVKTGVTLPEGKNLPGLPSNRTVHLRHHGRGYLYQGYATQIRSGSEAGYISHHASSHRHQQSLALGSLFDQLSRQQFHGPQTLMLLRILHYVHRIDIFCSHPALHFFSHRAPHFFRGHDMQAGEFSQPGDLRARATDRSRAAHHRVCASG